MSPPLTYSELSSALKGLPYSSINYYLIYPSKDFPTSISKLQNGIFLIVRQRSSW